MPWYVKQRGVSTKNVRDVDLGYHSDTHSDVPHTDTGWTDNYTIYHRWPDAYCGHSDYADYDDYSAYSDVPHQDAHTDVYRRWVRRVY